MERLPVELLDEVISYLDVPAPSSLKLRYQPLDDITKSSDTPLKNLSCVNHFFRELTGKLIFKALRIVFEESQYVSDSSILEPFFQIVQKYQLSLARVGLTVMVQKRDHEEPAYTIDELKAIAFDWKLLIETLNPSSVTLVAPPLVLASLAFGPLSSDPAVWHQQVFHMPYHILCVSSPTDGSSPPLENPLISESYIGPPPQFNLFVNKVWQSLLLNEGSYVRGYNPNMTNIPECIPSILRLLRSHRGIPETQLAELPRTISEFEYVAIWPFAMHVLDVLGIRHQLRRFALQVIALDNLAPDLQQRYMVDQMVLENNLRVWQRSLVQTFTGEAFGWNDVVEVELRDAKVWDPFGDIVREVIQNNKRWMEGERPGMLVRRRLVGS